MRQLLFQKEKLRQKNKHQHLVPLYLVPLALALLGLCTLSQSAGADEPSPLHILLDPGHGGMDSGATQGRLKESDLALKVAEQVRQLLAGDPQFKSSMTRNSDRFVSLPARVAQIDKLKADLFVSIHANSSQDKRARGVEFYFQNHLPADEETLFLAANENRFEQANEKTTTPASTGTATANTAETFEPSKKNEVLSIIDDLKRQTRMQASLKLSHQLLKSWSSEPDLKFESNAIRQAPFFVVSKAQVPSVLVEIGFITNPRDAEKLKDPKVHTKMAQRIYQGLKDYKEMMDKAEARTLKSSP